MLEFKKSEIDVNVKIASDMQQHFKMNYNKFLAYAFVPLSNEHKNLFCISVIAVSRKVHASVSTL